MRRNQRSKVAAVTTKEHGGSTIIRLGKAESAVLWRNFDAKRPQFREFFNHWRWDFAGAIDLVGINFVEQELLQFLQKGVALIAIFHALNWKRLKPRKIRGAHEQPADKGRCL